MKNIGLVGAGVLVGGVVGKMANTTIELNSFNKEFGKEASIEDREKLLKAYEILREEIMKNDTTTEIIIKKKVSMSGTEHPNYKIEILRNYIFRYLNSKPFHKVSVEGKVKSNIREYGVITIGDLDMLIGDIKIPQ